MKTTLQDKSGAVKADEPDMLIIHCPRVVQAAPWGDWAEDTVAYLLTLGWIERRERDAVHIISPLHPAIGGARAS